MVVELHDHGVDARVTDFHPRDGGVEQFVGGYLAPPHQVSQSQRIIVFVFNEFTHACHSHARTLMEAICPVGEEPCRMSLTLPSPAFPG
jgi:hypothetical protein